MSADFSSSPRRVWISQAKHREQLIRVTCQLFGTRGCDAVSVEEIANAVSVFKPIVHEHFEGRGDLYQAVVDREVETLSDILRSRMRSGRGARAVLEGIVVALLDFIEENADGFHLLAHQSPTVVRSETFETVVADITDQVTIFPAPLLEKQGLDPASAPIYGQILTGGVRQIGQWWSEDMQIDKKLVTAQVANLLYLGLRGMEKDPQLRIRWGATQPLYERPSVRR